MTDRVKAFLLMLLVPLTIAGVVALLYFGGQWLESEASDVAKFILGLVKAVALLLVALASFVMMLITYLSILEGLRNRKKRQKEGDLAR